MSSKKPTLCRSIVEAVLSELNERKGFDEWYGGVDRNIQKEIKQKLKLIVKQEIRKAVSTISSS
ncbi:MAG: hypothetical protein Sylvanvirus3_10 [Sylvanvirus sp.]|uniref:Uncharacterized protein n=1 Tax=Sylvanvirus sp. TaxID=2487774 RepID=A0A3G5AHC8_9VIRU|nr:MAG: hypothetical protein Sylvanvirus3_10 [Sylvanvirus sp.]